MHPGTAETTHQNTDDGAHRAYAACGSCTCSERNSNDCWASTSSASRISASFFRFFIWLLISASWQNRGCSGHALAW